MRRKPVFDIIRRLLGRPLRQREVNAIDAALDGLSRSDEGAASAPPWQIGPEGVALIKRFEGCARRRADGAFEAYPDPGTGGAPWTIGWGATGRDHVHGGRIAQGTVWSAAECEARLESDLARYAAEVAAAIGDAPTTQSQFDAMVSFHYNTGAIARATLTRRHRAGDHAGASREFDRWCFAGGRVMKGLVRRRAAEAALYRKPG
ncbi:lysozyme [Aurantiacibacter luteus]|uniref:Lysozyme n=1 Tax=Aurantiacibacter luteus TaxID=1581420 RepID=A0A0G9MSS2_9SPHN|nr:lysozyme [Aurantiacibacter luteus]KLE33802.1 glycoside hydrolase [Aurantiacibacter luteus]